MDRWRPPERGGTLAGARVRVGREEGRTVKPAQRSPGLDRRHVGRATTANRRWQRRSEVVMLELGEEGRRMGMGAARTG
jgi:hypothetical protein